MNRIVSFLVISILFWNNCSVSAQTKMEHEVRINRDQVPPSALEFIDGAPFNKKIKWYKEYGLTDTSIEAKTRYGGVKYSVEFSKSGQLEDIEVVRSWKEIPSAERQKMEDYLQEIFNKYTINKLQFQYSGGPLSLQNWLKTGNRTQDIALKYELIVHSKVEGKFKRFEFLFEADGSFIKKSELIQKNADNIEY